MGVLHVRVSATDGVIALDGYVTSRLRAAQLEAAVSTVPGVWGVENRLFCDDELTIVVAQALSEDARTRAHPIRLTANHGVMTLDGSTPDAGIAEVARQLAASVPGVLMVENRLRTPGIRREQRVVEGATDGGQPASMIPHGSGA